MMESLEKTVANAILNLEKLRSISENRDLKLHGSLGAFHKVGGLVEAHVQIPQDPSQLSIKDQEERFGIIFHEFTHWLQYISTPFGMFSSRVQELQTQTIRLLCYSLVNGVDFQKQNQLHMPFVDWIFRALPGGNPWGCFQGIRAWLASENILLCLDGDLELDKDTAAESFLICDYLMSIQYSSFSELQFPRGQKLKTLTALDTSIVPIVDGKPLGARQLNETAARLQELGIKYGYDKIDEKQLTGDYGIAFKLLRRHFPYEKVDYIVKTVLALADLALWSEIEPVVRNKNLEELNWYDIHPGWRFMKCIEQIKSTDLIHDFDQYESYINSLSRKLGWSSLQNQIANAISSIDSSDNILLQYFRRCCLKRKELPWFFSYISYTPPFDTVIKEFKPPIMWMGNEFMFSGEKNSSMKTLKAHDTNIIVRQFALKNCFDGNQLFSSKLPPGGANMDSFFENYIEEVIFLPLRRIIRD